MVPAVATGLGGGALAAVAASRAWVEVDTGSAVTAAVLSRPGAGEMPLASTLSLVLLAGWGALLVTRGRVRRALSWLALAAAVGLLGAVVAGGRSLPAGLRDEALAGSAVAVDVTLTGWYWLALAGSLAASAGSALAVRSVPSWPQMGSRYDAPAGRIAGRTAGTGAHTEADPEASPLDLWRALDEGRDPTT